MIIISIPKVQGYVAMVITDDINNKYNTDISLDKISISFFGNIQIKDALIKDHHQDTLFYFDELETGFKNLRRFNQNEFDFSGVEFENLIFNLKRYKSEEKDNLSYFLDNFSTGKSKEKKPFSLSLDYLAAVNSRFRYTDENLNNSDIVDIREINLNLKSINIKDDGVFINIQNISGKAKEGLIIDELSTEFTYTPSYMNLKSLNLITDHSHINTDIEFLYNNNDLSQFEDNVEIKANFKQSVISTSDLNLYYNSFGQDQDLSLKGDLTGTLNDMKWVNTQISGLKETGIVSNDLQLQNLLSSNSNFLIAGDFKQLSTSHEDLINLLPGLLKNNLPEFLKRLGKVNIKGKNAISEDKIKINSKINSDIGSLRLNANLSEYTKEDLATYSGRINIDQFHLGKILNTEDLGIARGDFQINGKGFNTASLNTTINGSFSQLYFKNYNYTDISVNGNLQNPIFDGSFVSKDENFDFKFDGLIDVSKSLNQYKFIANVNYADLHAVNWIKRDTLSIFKGKMDVDLKGTTLNNTVGDINLTDITYRNQIDDYAFDALEIQSNFKNDVRRIDIISNDVISGYIQGIFNVTELPEIIRQSIENLYFNKKPYQDEDFNYVDFNLSIKNKVIDVLLPNFKIKPNTYVKGSIVKDNNIFKLRFNSPQINIFKNKLQNVDFQIDNTNPLYNTYVKIDSIASPTYPVSEFSLINKNINDTLYFRTEFKGGKKNDDEVKLSLYQTNKDDNESIIGLQNSSILFKKTKWLLNPDNNRKNRVIFNRDLNNFSFDSIAMRYKDEKILLDGRLEDSTYKDLNLKLQNVDLYKITPEIDSLKLRGQVNGVAKIYQEKGLYAPNLKMQVSNFKINDSDLGQLSLFANGDEAFKDFEVQAKITDQETEFLNAKGAIKTENQEQFIDLTLSTDQLDLSAFSPLGQDVVSNLRGQISGTAQLEGILNNPDFNGSYKWENGGIGIPYLNVDYNFNQQETLKLSGKKIIFNNFDLTDVKYNTKGQLNGNINHEYFSQWNLDLNISTDNLVALDTQFKEGDLYYGTAFISGNANISGSTNELAINVNAQTQPNTVFKIPLDDTKTLADNSYIYFLTKEDKDAKKVGKNIQLRDLSGLDLSFDLDITRDAEVEILIDQDSGSTLRGSGAGNLLIEINTNGKFNMWGDFVAYQGIYNFKYAGLVQKEFQVVPGGSLTWNGNPLDANMNVQAKYTTDANPSVILENTNMNREVPVDVLINLRGQLMQPNISFDLQYPNLSSIVESELNYRIQGEENQELQALSLVTQGSFYSLKGLGQNAITGNLIERASGIVDNILASESEKFKLGINYQQGQQTPTQNAQTSDRLGMTFKTQISDRVSIKGEFGVPVGGETESFIFGDIELSLMLNESGSLRATAFNRESEIQFIGEELGYTQGVGITYSVDFDTLRGLIGEFTKPEEEESEVPDGKNPKKPNKKSVVPEYIQLKRERN
ncbi:MAG: translocation/assembly module TamB domain-containing protein [Psychroflexus sp.]|nr:translocation/assembly module TamB domain-containing protein [Psychroflexus sp.]